MPTHMRGGFTPAELKGAELVPPFPFTKDVPLRDLIAHPEAEAVLRTHFTALLDGPFAQRALDLSLLQIAALAIGLLPTDRLRAIATSLAAIGNDPPAATTASNAPA